MAHQKTKQELEQEIKALNEILKVLTQSQSGLVDGCLNMIKLNNRYNNKLRNLDRTFSKQVQVVLIFVLLVNTILLATKVF